MSEVTPYTCGPLTPSIRLYFRIIDGSIEEIAGPGYWTFDLALAKTLKVRENKSLEFRAEAFNLTNSVRYNNPTSNLNTNTFDQITSAQAPRIMQFALKYVF